MAFRFSKSFKFGPARLNLSKQGAGMSLGSKGFRVGIGPRGSYTNLSIPGTGISHRSYLGAWRGRKGRNDPATEARALKTVFGCLGIGFVTFTEFILLAAAPHVGFPVVATTIGLFVWSRWSKSKNPKWQFKRKGQEVVRNINGGNWEAAVRSLEDCERIIPGKPETAGLKGQALFHMKRFEDAIPLLQAGMATETETMMLAEALRHVKRFRESIDVLKNRPVDKALAAQALVIRAANHVELGEAETAIEILKTAPLKKRILDDTLKQVHYVLAKAYEQTGKPAEAVKHLRRVYAADPAFMDVESELGRVQSNLNGRPPSFV